MKRKFFTILLIIFGSLGLFGQTKSIQKAETTETGFSDEEYKIWSEFWCRTRSDELFVIKNETFPMTHSLIKDKKYLVNGDDNFVRKIRDYYAKNKIADVTNELFNDFNSKNDKSYSLKRNFSGCKNYVLVTESDLSDISEKPLGDYWKDFKTKYPKARAVIRFSRIGFSPDKKQAIIYLDYSCGNVCGSHDYYFFVKENDDWIERATYNVGIS